MKLLPTEQEIQKTIISYLQLQGFYVMRLNSGSFAVGTNETRRFIKGQDAGTPDLLAFKKTHKTTSIQIHNPTTSQIHLLFIEVKRPGNKPTVLQQQKMKTLEEFGAICLIATSVEDLIPYLKLPI